MYCDNVADELFLLVVEIGNAGIDTLLFIGGAGTESILKEASSGSCCSSIASKLSRRELRAGFCDIAFDETLRTGTFLFIIPSKSMAWLISFR